MAQWLEELHPGDRVFVRHGYATDLFAATVSRVTKTQVTVDIGGTETTYLKRNGRRKGSNGYFVARIQPVNEQTLSEFRSQQKQVKKRMLVRNLDRIDWRLFTDEDLSELEQLIERVICRKETT